MRKYFLINHKRAGIETVEIERIVKARGVQHFCALVYVAQPGIILGKEGKIDKIEKDLNYIVGRKTKVKVIIKQSAAPQKSARLIAREIADGIENRMSFRRVQKMAIKKALMGGALGIKTKVSGRLGGAEIARDEGYSEGVVPLSTLRADIDYALELAKTTYGIIGVKVWINRGLYFGKGFMPTPEAPAYKPRSNFYQDRDGKNRNNRRRRFSDNRTNAVNEQQEGGGAE